jgi:hypothetical protein
MIALLFVIPQRHISQSRLPAVILSGAQRSRRTPTLPNPSQPPNLFNQTLDRRCSLPETLRPIDESATTV